VISETRRSVVGCTKLQVGRSKGRVNLFSPSSRIVALGSAQPLTELSTRNLTGGEGLPAHKADNLTAICESIV
jgi:hypothetical protein